MTDQNPMRRVDDLKSAIARHRTKMAELESRKPTTQPKDLPALHREIASLAEVGAMLHEALAASEPVLRDAEEKLAAARDACIKDMSSILGELTQASGRFERGLADIRAAVEARRAAVEKLRPLMLGSVDNWQKSGTPRFALEQALHDVLGFPERSSSETLSNKDSLIASSCRAEAARVAARDKAA